ncbi:hypothetical protein [Polymorphum gilvum]|uniref:hypothetical protein n=1 Tax=Polymorphum gilvum TaxID=991904 RepID=UPI0011D1B9D2|nr:hypothetical protein [Polymorphum gilvum]
MKLKDYVKQTLLDICAGVSEAKEASEVWIAPGYVDGKRVASAQLVTFEINTKINKEGGAGIEVWSTADLKASGASEHTNKISFSVPIFFEAPKKKGE